MPFAETPVLPEWDDSLSLPPSFDETMKEKKADKEQGQDD